MDLILVGVFDRSVDAYTTIQPFRADAEAVRNFIDAAANPSSGVMHTHTDDFDLYALATFDTSNGKITPEPTPRKIADGKQLQLQRANNANE